MNSTTAPVVESEPTLRDVLVAVNGLGAEVHALGTSMGSLKTELTALTGFMQVQYSQLSGEIAHTRSDVAAIRNKVDVLEQEVAEIGPLAREAVTIGRDNRELIHSLRQDVARIDEKLDRHINDDRRHLPGEQWSTDPAGPMAA